MHNMNPTVAGKEEGFYLAWPIGNGTLVAGLLMVMDEAGTGS